MSLFRWRSYISIKIILVQVNVYMCTLVSEWFSVCVYCLVLSRIRHIIRACRKTDLHVIVYIEITSNNYRESHMHTSNYSPCNVTKKNFQFLPLFIVSLCITISDPTYLKWYFHYSAIYSFCLLSRVIQTETMNWNIIKPAPR